VCPDIARKNLRADSTSSPCPQNAMTTSEPGRHEPIALTILSGVMTIATLVLITLNLTGVIGGFWWWVVTGAVLLVEVLLLQWRYTR
jgi:hypothetical protein